MSFWVRHTHNADDVNGLTDSSIVLWQDQPGQIATTGQVEEGPVTITFTGPHDTQGDALDYIRDEHGLTIRDGMRPSPTNNGGRLDTWFHVYSSADQAKEG